MRELGAERRRAAAHASRRRWIPNGHHEPRRAAARCLSCSWPSTPAPPRRALPVQPRRRRSWRGGAPADVDVAGAGTGRAGRRRDLARGAAADPLGALAAGGAAPGGRRPRSASPPSAPAPWSGTADRSAARRRWCVWSDLRGVDARRRAAGGRLSWSPRSRRRRSWSLWRPSDRPAERAAAAGSGATSTAYPDLAAHRRRRARHRPQPGLADRLSRPRLTMGWNRPLIAHQGLDAAMFPQLVDTWGRLAADRRRVRRARSRSRPMIADQQAALIAHGATAGDQGDLRHLGDAGPRRPAADFVLKEPATPPFVSARWRARRGSAWRAWSTRPARRSTGCGGDGRAQPSPRSTPWRPARPTPAAAVSCRRLQGLGAPHRRPRPAGRVAGLAWRDRPRADRPRRAWRALRSACARCSTHLTAPAKRAPALSSADGGLAGSDVSCSCRPTWPGRPVAPPCAARGDGGGAAICAARGVGVLGADDAGGFARHEALFEPRIGADEADARCDELEAAAYG